MIKKFLLVVLLLCILILAELFSFSHINWSLSNLTLYGRDVHRHADLFFMGYHIFSPGVLKYMVHFYQGLHNFVSWPPLYYITFGSLMKILGFEGPNWFPLHFARLILWWLYGVILWALGKRVWASLEGGLLALGLLWFNPVILSQTFSVDSDFPGFVSVAAATFGLLYGNDFSKIGRSVLFGLLCGFALLTRASTVVFIIGLYIAAQWFFWTSSPEGRLKAFKNLVIAALITSLCAALFYVPFFSTFMEHTKEVFSGRSLTLWPKYLLYLANRYTSLFLPILIMFLFANIILILKRDKYFFAFAPLILISVVFFSSYTTDLVNEELIFAYMLPLLIYPVIFIIRAVSLIPSGILRSCISVIIILFSITGFAWNYAPKMSTSYNRYATDIVRYAAGIAMKLPNKYKDALFSHAGFYPSIFPSDTSRDDFFISNLALLQILKRPYFKDSPTIIIFYEVAKERGWWSLGDIVYRYPIPIQWGCYYPDRNCLTDNVGRDTVFFVDNKRWCLEAKMLFLSLGHEVEKAMYIKSPAPNPDGVGFCLVRFKNVAR